MHRGCILLGCGSVGNEVWAGKSSSGIWAHISLPSLTIVVVSTAIFLTGVICPYGFIDPRWFEILKKGLLDPRRRFGGVVFEGREDRFENIKLVSE